MKSHFSRALAWAKVHYIFTLIIFVAAVLVVIKAFSANSSGNIETITLKPQEFLRTVEVAGKVVPSEDVELGFETSGRIAAVYKKEGDRAHAGETIAVLNTGDVSADIMKAQADLDAEIARLNELKRGANNESSSIENSKTELFEALSDAYTRSDDAVRNNVDQFYEDPRSNNPEIIFAFNDDNLRDELNETRKDVEFMLTGWKQSLDSINASKFVDVDIALAEENLRMTKNFLDRISLAVNDFQTTGGMYTQTEIDKFKSDVSNARSSVNAAITNLVQAKESVRDLESEIPYQEARVKAAQATINSYKSELTKKSITAPFAGVVTQQDAKVGEIVAANTPVVRLISDAKYTIETFIPEINIKEVSVGNVAQVTLDAYGEDVIFEARVITIDPGETIKDGVSTYKVLFEFTTEDERLKSGMTANVEIKTETKQGALLIPQEAVVGRDGFTYVYILVGKQKIEKQITTGAIASNGYIEVVAGLSDGEVVVKNAQ